MRRGRLDGSCRFTFFAFYNPGTEKKRRLLRLYTQAPRGCRGGIRSAMLNIELLKSGACYRRTALGRKRQGRELASRNKIIAFGRTTSCTARTGLAWRNKAGGRHADSAEAGTRATIIDQLWSR